MSRLKIARLAAVIAVGALWIVVVPSMSWLAYVVGWPLCFAIGWSR